MKIIFYFFIGQIVYLSISERWSVLFNKFFTFSPSIPKVLISLSPSTTAIQPDRNKSINRRKYFFFIFSPLFIYLYNNLSQKVQTCKGKIAWYKPQIVHLTDRQLGEQLKPLGMRDALFLPISVFLNYFITAELINYP